MIVAFGLGCVVALAWSSAQTASEPALVDELEPDRVAQPVTVTFVASDGSPVSDAIDRTSGSLGWSHCYLDVGHHLPDGSRLIVDYQPGAGVHYARSDAYDGRSQARVRLEGRLGCELWGCVRSKLGQPFDAAGALLGKATTQTCSGLVWSCLPPDMRRQVNNIGRPVAPNDLAAMLGAQHGRTTTYRRMS